MTRLEDVLPDRRAASVWGAGHRVACLLGVLVLSVGPTVAGAHHSFAICTDEVTEVEGELVDVHWGNPHVRLTIHAEESDRETVWNLETGNPYVLQRRGVARADGRIRRSLRIGGDARVMATPYPFEFRDDSLGTPQSERIETFETLTLSDDQQRLDYEMIVTDPETFTEPATAMETHWLAIGESLAEPTHCAEYGPHNAHGATLQSVATESSLW